MMERSSLEDSSPLTTCDMCALRKRAMYAGSFSRAMVTQPGHILRACVLSKMFSKSSSESAATTLGDRSGRMSGVSRTCHGLSSTPVSYTHLDVYKRQSFS